jgi:hypothetical protein
MKDGSGDLKHAETMNALRQIHEIAYTALRSRVHEATYATSKTRTCTLSGKRAASPKKVLRLSQS